MSDVYRAARAGLQVGQANWRSVDVGVLPLRGLLGLLFVLHGGTKLFGWFPAVAAGVPGTAAFFTMLGIQPEPLVAVLIGLLEFLGGIALIFGLLTRVVGLLLCVDMVVAILLVGPKLGFFVTTKAGWEFNLCLATAALSLAIIGPGALSLDSLFGLARRVHGSGSGVPAAASRPAVADSHESG